MSTCVSYKFSIKLLELCFLEARFFYFRQREVLSETYDVGDEFISIGDGFSCTVSNQNNAVVEGMCESVVGDFYF